MNKRRFLIVEDNATIRKLTRELITLSGFDCLEAGEAGVGIELAKTKLPDLIFMDVTLPDCDGLEAVAELKRNSFTRHIPIIALTADAMGGDRQRALESGCSGYLNKPVQPKFFVECVTRLGFVPATRKSASALGLSSSEAGGTETPFEESSVSRVSLPKVGAKIAKKKMSAEIVETPQENGIFMPPVRIPASARALITLPDVADREVAENALKNLGCALLVTREPLQMVSLVEQQRPHLVVFALGLSGTRDDEVVRYLRKDPKNTNTAILVALPTSDREGRTRAYEAGADDVVSLPIDSKELTARARVLLGRQAAREEAQKVQDDADAAFRHRTATLRHNLLEKQATIDELTETVARIQWESVDALAIPAEQYRGMRTGDDALHHLDAVSEICAFFGRGLGLSPDEVGDLRLASRLHDIGNLYIADRLVNPAAVLDAVEAREWRQHTNLGSWFLSQFASAIMADARIIAQGHHERWDGTGFPRQVSGDAIPLPARICALAHAIDDLAQYGTFCDAGVAPPQSPGPMTNLHLLEAIATERGKRFDPTLIDLVRSRQGEFLALLGHLYS
jgi:putative two-component system response regulator